jgi:hypothetical protein
VLEVLLLPPELLELPALLLELVLLELPLELVLLELPLELVLPLDVLPELLVPCVAELPELPQACSAAMAPHTATKVARFIGSTILALCVP